MSLSSYVISTHTFMLQVTGLLSSDKLRQAASLIKSAIIGRHKLVIDVIGAICPDGKDFGECLKEIDATFQLDYLKHIVFVLPYDHPYRQSITNHFRAINSSYKLFFCPTLEDALVVR